MVELWKNFAKWQWKTRRSSASRWSRSTIFGASRFPNWRTRSKSSSSPEILLDLIYWSQIR